MTVVLKRMKQLHSKTDRGFSHALCMGCGWMVFYASC